MSIHPVDIYMEQNEAGGFICRSDDPEGCELCEVGENCPDYHITNREPKWREE